MNDKARARFWFHIYRSATTALGTLPFSLASRLGEIFGAVAYYFASSVRATVKANLQRIVDPTTSVRSLNHLVRSSFRSYGRYWTELACAANRGDKFDQLTVSLENWQYIDDAVASGRGVIVALPHLGSWDVAGSLIVRKGTPLTTVAEHASSPELFDFFIEKRSNLGLKVFPFAPDTANRLVAELRSGGVLSLVADRDVIGDGVEVEFFGAKTRAPGGPAVLAFRTHADLVPAAVFDDARGHYRVVAHPPINVERVEGFRADVQRVTQSLVHEFESFIRIAPQNWHVFQRHWPDASEVTSVEDRAISETTHG